MSIVFYASETKLTDDHQPVTVKGWKDGSEKTVYVRAELREDSWPGPAMRSATPQSGEIALNAVPNAVVVGPKESPDYVAPIPE